MSQSHDGDDQTRIAKCRPFGVVSRHAARASLRMDARADNAISIWCGRYSKAMGERRAATGADLI
jgi:hypothetical protein